MKNNEFKALSYLDKIKHNLPAIIAFSNEELIESTQVGSDNYVQVSSLNYIQNFPHRVKSKTVKKWFNIYSTKDKSLYMAFEIVGNGYLTKERADKERTSHRIACIEIEVPVEV